MRISRPYSHRRTSPETHFRSQKEEDVQLFHQIAKETAHLVKKYKGSLSGEHGDRAITRRIHSHHDWGAQL